MLGAPLMQNFLTQARELRYSQGLAEKLKPIFDRVFEYQGDLLRTKAYLSSDLDNVENLFSMLDMDWQIHSVEVDKSRSEKLRIIRESLFALVIETLRGVQQSHRFVEYYQIIKFLATAAESSFITFNYDMAVEAALEQFDRTGRPDFAVDYGVNPSRLNTSANKRTVLKLHGSLNWVYCTACKRFSMPKNPLLPDELESNRHLLHDEKSCLELKKFINVIIPPTWNKTNYLDEITKVWYAAVSEISQATHLFIIGYSFPRTDVFFDQMLGLALRDSKNLKKVVVLNPSAETKTVISGFFEQHFFSKMVVFVPLKFEALHNYIDREKLESQKGMDVLINSLTSVRVS
jgi:NAD-dependent SIR2 family protein deacetylase